MPFDPLQSHTLPDPADAFAAADLSQWMTNILRRADTAFGIEPAVEIARFLAAQSLRS